jgi:four helix bundle protein
MKTHRDLNVWTNSINLVTMIYRFTNDFPKSEIFGITSQIRKAAVSIPSNIAEGAARKSKKEFNNFLSIALGSASELETQIIISKNLGYLSNEKSGTLLNELLTIQKMIAGLMKNIQSSAH